MTKPCRIISVFLVLVVFTFPVLTQTRTDDEDEVSAQEKIKLTRFTKRFVKRMQQTRDVRLLLKEFFIRDYEKFLSFMFLSESKGKRRYTPTPSEMRSFSIPLTNLLYAYGLGVVLDPDERYGEGLNRLLPKSLARRVSQFEDKMEQFGEPRSRHWFHTNLLQHIKLANDVRAFLTKKNFERSKQYRDSVSIREKNETCNYPIEVIFNNVDEDSDNDVVGWLRQFGPDTRAFSVGTPPIGLAVMIVRVNGIYRAFGVWTHPFSGGAYCR